MDEYGCPRCKTTKYRNPSLKLMVNACGHSLCESCVDMLFIKGSGACPECGTALRRNNYRLQVFENPEVEKEVDIRKKILKIYNKKEEDFSSLRDYNNYLEMIEDIILNLANGVDADATQRRIEQYKKENKDQIRKNQGKMSKDEDYLEQLIAEEKAAALRMRQQQKEEEHREKALKRKRKESLIDDLMFSDKAAMDIVATHKWTSAQPVDDQAQPTSAGPTVFSSGIRMSHQSVFDNRETEETKAYQYSPLELDSNGPAYPTMDCIMTKGYLRNVRGPVDMEIAGGFEPQIACQRALQDAFCGLFHFPSISNANSPSASSSLTQDQEEGYSPMYLS